MGFFECPLKSFFCQMYFSASSFSIFFLLHKAHTIYIRNNMGQKCEGNCGLWVLHEILKKTYPENLKKIVGTVNTSAC